MGEVQLKLDEHGNGKFFIPGADKELGEMVIGIKGNILTVFHTEVAPEAEGKGLAKLLLAAMVHHARHNGLRVNALCPYVKAQFARHNQEYADIMS